MIFFPRTRNNQSYQALIAYDYIVIKHQNLGQMLYFCPKFWCLITPNLCTIRYTFTSPKIQNMGYIQF